MWAPSPDQEERIRGVSAFLLDSLPIDWLIDGEGRMPACGPCSGGPRLSLATYRIHLGTFAAHASFGAQLTSLPEAPERVTSVLDPLVGSEGSWLHEVMKKVAVLSLDASITDSVFRRQIQGGR